MTTREVRCLATHRHQPSADEATNRAGWAATCQAAYQTHRDNIPVLEVPGVTGIEPFGVRPDGDMEWRTYWHSADGTQTTYVRILVGSLPSSAPESTEDPAGPQRPVL